MAAIFYPYGSLASPLIPQVAGMAEPKARLVRDLRFLGVGELDSLGSKKLALLQAASVRENHGSLPNDSDSIESILKTAGGLPATHEGVESLFEGWVLCSDNRIYHPRLCALIAESFNCASLQSAIAQAAFNQRSLESWLDMDLLLLSQTTEGEIFKTTRLRVPLSLLGKHHEEGTLSKPSHVWGPKIAAQCQENDSSCERNHKPSVLEDDLAIKWSQEALGADPRPKVEFPATLFSRGAAGMATGAISAQHFRSVMPFFANTPISKINSSWKTISMAFGGSMGMQELELCYQFCLAKKGDSLNLAYFTKLCVELSFSVKRLVELSWVEIELKSEVLNLNNKATQVLIETLPKAVSQDQKDYVLVRLQKALVARGKDRDKKLFDLISDIENFDVLHCEEELEVVSAEDRSGQIDVYRLM